MPEAKGPATAVVVSGGKQYVVAAGDRILVDRLPDEPGAEVQFPRVLMLASDGEAKVLPAELQAARVTARVLRHTRGPKIDVLRYKAKKRVRVRRGARAELTAVEVLSLEPAAGGRARRGAAKAEPAGGADEAKA